jgi:hypothetical protein
MLAPYLHPKLTAIAMRDMPHWRSDRGHDTKHPVHLGGGKISGKLDRKSTRWKRKSE